LNWNLTVRPVLFALLFANLAYFAWAHWVDAPRPVVENAALAKLPRLKMRNEVVQPVSAPVPGSAHKVALKASGAGSCVAIGPFGDIGSSARAAAVLKDKGFDPQQRAVAGETSDGFWVYVAGLKSDDDVERVRRDLVYHGITDAQAMTGSGATDRRVSVGLFSERERAEKRAKQVQHLGLKAEVAERKLPASVYWVDVTPHSRMSSVPIDDLLAEGIGSKVGVEACPPPAVTASPQATAAATPKLP
jgi:sporulation related protein